MGVVLPAEGFLKGLRDLTLRNGALLIFDEVITGFRVAPGGAQELYGMRPDLTCLGKIIGGGLPVGAYGGKREIMERMAPEGNVYQAGTLSGNPLAMAAGLATLRRLSEPGVYETLEERARELTGGLVEIARGNGVELTAGCLGGLLGFFFHPGPVRNFEDAKKARGERFRRFFAAMLEEGVYLAPSPFEAAFVSLAHRPREIAQTLDAAARAMKRVARVR
jgi:glutamate-1-semialdehyde 2,1-aminomutase